MTGARNGTLSSMFNFDLLGALKKVKICPGEATNKEGTLVDHRRKPYKPVGERLATFM